ncbi:MAG: hypothetical protein WKG00_00695 [Polyangiaceae bacterium]
MTSPEYVIAPHALAWGGARRAEVLVDDAWHELPHGDGHFQVHPVGDALAIDEYTFSTAGRDPVEDPREQGATGVFVYHRGRLAPFHIPPTRCATPAYGETPPEIACFGCGETEPYLRLQPSRRRDEPCGTLHYDSYDTHGRLRARRRFTSPAASPDVEGRLPSGQWILAERKPSSDFLFFGAPAMRFSLGPGGLSELPFGADPLHRGIDSEQRAEKILREVPLRDAAVAALREAMAEGERAQPGWVVRTEVVNQLSSPGQALEPRVEARPGRCYTMVARSSSELARLSIAIRGDARDLSTSLRHLDAPPLVRVAGSSVVIASRCVSAGDLPLLQLRIESAAAGGYVVARIYEHAPAD